MKRLYMSVAFAAAQGMIMSAPAHAEDVVINGSVTEIFGHHAIVSTDQKKYLVNFGPRVSDQGIVKTGDTVSVTGDLKKNGQVRAHMLTLADGRVVEVAKDKKTWTEWLIGEDADDNKPFTAADAKKLATDKGFTLTSELIAEKRHFVAIGTKDGKTYEIALHRDGNVETETAFTAADAKKLAADKGYTLTGEPVAEKRHFMGTATKDGKTFELALHRDGTVKEAMSLNSVQAKKAMMDKGYDVIGEPEPAKKHFEALASKNAEFFEVHAHRDGSVEETRKVDKTDPRWGSKIR